MSTSTDTTTVPELRERRLAVGLSQQALAERAACSLSTVRLVEYGVRPSDAMAKRIETALRAADSEGGGP